MKYITLLPCHYEDIPLLLNSRLAWLLRDKWHKLFLLSQDFLLERLGPFNSFYLLKSVLLISVFTKVWMGTFWGDPQRVKSSTRKGWVEYNYLFALRLEGTFLHALAMARQNISCSFKILHGVPFHQAHESQTQPHLEDGCWMNASLHYSNMRPHFIRAHCMSSIQLVFLSIQLQNTKMSRKYNLYCGNHSFPNTVQGTTQNTTECHCFTSPQVYKWLPRTALFTVGL